MDFSVIDLALVAKLLLLLLIGMGPKIALVPFLEKTKHFDAETQRAVGRRMVMTAGVTALVLFVFGALLMRLLHITGGAVAVGGGESAAPGAGEAAAAEGPVARSCAACGVENDTDAVFCKKCGARIEASA